MPVQIPRIQSSGPVAPTETVQTNIGHMPDVSQGTGLQQGIVSAANNIEDRINFEAQQHADSVKKDAQEQYTSFYRPNSEALRETNGDPTPAFAKFDQDAKKKQDDILQNLKDSGADERTLTTAQQGLQQIQGTLYNKRLTDEAVAKRTYQKNTDNAAIAMQSQNVMDAGFHLDKKDPTSFGELQKQMLGVEQATLSSGKNDGLVTYNEDGTIKDMDPILQARLAVNKSQALSPLLSALNASGKTDEAKAVLAQYRDQMTPKAYAAAVKMGAEVGVNQKAFGMYQQIQNLPDDQINKTISQVQDPQMREKLTTIRNADMRGKMQNEELTSKKNFTAVLPLAQQAQQDGKSWAEFQTTPIYLKMKSEGLINDKYDKKLKDSIEIPDDSKPDVKNQMLAHFSEPGGLRALSDDDFKSQLAGLNKQDRSWFTRIRQNEQNPDSGSNVSGLRWSMNTGLKQAMISSGDIRYMPGTNKLSKNDQKKFDDASTQFGHEYEHTPLGNDPVRLKDNVGAWVANRTKSSIFGSGTPSPAVPAGSPIPTSTPFQGSAVTKKAPAPVEMSDQDMGAAITAYNKANPSKPWNTVPGRNLNMLANWYATNKKGK